MGSTIINSAAMCAISLCCFSCNQENEGTASPTTQSDNSIASDVEAGNQDQQEKATEPTTTWEEKKARIKAAIVALDNRPNSDAFVTIDDQKTGKGFQFFSSPGDPINLFVPLLGLNDEEAKRAAVYFAEFGISDIDLERMQAYVIDLDHDHERAANVAINVFEKIYQLPSDFKMKFDES